MRTSTLKSSPRSPPNLGGSAEGVGGLLHVLLNLQQEAHLRGAAPKARGACSRILQNRRTRALRKISRKMKKFGNLLVSLLSLIIDGNPR